MYNDRYRSDAQAQLDAYAKTHGLVEVKNEQ